MITLKGLMETGDDFTSRHILSGTPDWQALHDQTPDDALDDEEEFSDDDEPAENTADAMSGIREALAEDMRPLGDALWAAYQAGDEAATRGALRTISRRMPELALAVANTARAMGAEFAAAWVGDESAE